MTNAVIYARYSSDLQRDASIEDQIRLCKERAKREGWRVTNCYTDHAISGASLIRPGMQMLLQDAQAGKFDVIIAEAIDRLSRDQEDIAGLFKRFAFMNVKNAPKIFEDNVFCSYWSGHLSHGLLLVPAVY